MTTNRGHSPVGASSRYRYKACPGSVNLCKKSPPAPSNAYAEEGTIAHEHAAYYLANQNWLVGCPEEMKEQLYIYTDAVFEDKASLDQTYQGNLFLVEHGFDLSMLHPDAWGTADCVIYDAKLKLLYVYDLKYGAGILVEAVDNEQLQYYAVGAFLSLDLPVKEVILKIAQPRCDHADGLVREHRFGAEKLLEYAADIEAEIKATDDPKASLIPGSHCRFCPALGTPCPAASKNAMAVAKKIFAPTQSYDPQVLTDTLEKLPMLDAFVSQVREFAYAEALKGRVPPNYKLVAKRATRKWKPDSGVGKFLSKVCSSEQLKSCFTQPEIKSPAQIEKVLPKNNHDKLKEFIVAESSGYKLAHVSESGEPILLDAKSVFSNGAEDDCEALFK